MPEHTPQVLLEVRDTYAPRVLRRGGRLLWEMYVARGFADRVVELPISEADLGVLRADEERYWFLFAALHHPYQLTETYLDDAELARWCKAVLHVPQAQTEEFLTRLEHGRANGAISNLLRIFRLTISASWWPPSSAAASTPTLPRLASVSVVEGSCPFEAGQCRHPPRGAASG